MKTPKPKSDLELLHEALKANSLPKPKQPENVQYYSGGMGFKPLATYVQSAYLHELVGTPIAIRFVGQRPITSYEELNIALRALRPANKTFRTEWFFIEQWLRDYAKNEADLKIEEISVI